MIRKLTIIRPAMNIGLTNAESFLRIPGYTDHHLHRLFRIGRYVKNSTTTNSKENMEG